MVKLHLGCGRKYKKGYINCDISPDVKPDKVIDLEKKLPFKNNSVEEIIIEHCLEHVFNFVGLVHEMHRVCKNRARIKIKVPFYSSWGQFNDPTHVRFFTPFTFNYFSKNSYSHEVRVRENMFKIIKIKINFAVGRLSFLNNLVDPIINFNHSLYCRFFAWIFPASEIYYELEVVK